MPARMRFLNQALEELRKDDPETSIAMHYLCALAASGEIPFVAIGKRKLLNYDALVEFLKKPPRKEFCEQGTIRRIDK